MQCYLGPSPRDWRTLIHFNVVLTVFHIGHISQGVCKTVRTTFWCIIVLQSRGEGPEKAHNYGTDLGQIFRTFSPQLENNDTLKCSSDSFAHTLIYVVNVANCRNYIEIFQCPPIAGRRSKIALKLGGLRISECNLCICTFWLKRTQSLRVLWGKLRLLKPIETSGLFTNLWKAKFRNPFSIGFQKWLRFWCFFFRISRQKTLDSRH